MTLASPIQTQPGPGARLVSVDGRAFPLRSAAIVARAEGGLADSRLIQTYTNPHDEALEVIYTMPLPADGAVVGYTITIGDRKITGEIETREQAQEDYQRALEEGRTAGLLDEERADTFTQKLGNLPAGETAKIEIRVLHLLAFVPRTGENEPAWEYRFPTVVGVRYQGGPGRVPDADKLDVDRADGAGTPVRLELDLLLADGDPAELEPRSESHDIRTAASDAGCRISLDEAAPLDCDLVIAWGATTDEVGVRLVEGRGLPGSKEEDPGDDGRYGLLTITPPARPETTFHRDLTLLIDSSGSMTNEPLETAKEVAAQLLRRLGPDDRFELVAFSSQPVRLVRGPVKATRVNVRRGLDRLRALRAGGGTEMAHAMIEALKPLRPDTQRQVILLTDGDIGFEEEVVGEVSRRLQPGSRIHVVGVGWCPNRSLTRDVARAGRGVEVFIADGTNPNPATERLLQATVGPVLTDLSIGGTACRAVAPQKPQDVLAGQPLIVAVELAPEGGTVEVRGRLAGSREEWKWTLDASVQTTPTELPIGALFGREAVADRELQLAASPVEQATIESAIEALGIRHRITTRRTSLVAIADEPTVDPKEPRRRRRLEVELPAGVSAEGVGLQQPLYAAIAAPRGWGIDKATVRHSIISKDRPAGPVPFVMDQGMQFLEEAPVRRDFDEPLPIARVVRVEGDLLVVEFEAPEDGFLLPDDEAVAELHVADGDTIEAVVDGNVSTWPGPHEHGLTLRLGLRRKDVSSWPDDSYLLRWTSPDGTVHTLGVETGSQS